MATTYTFQDLMNVVSRVLPRMVEQDAAAYICNTAIAQFWKAYDFRETLQVLPPFYLIPMEQDHGTPAVAVPSDFLGLRNAYLCQLASNPAYRSQLSCLKDLPLTQVYGLPQSIGYEPAKLAFRLFPRVPANIGAPSWIIQGEYKKRPTKITADILSSTLVPFDDIYLENMMEVFKWAGWQFAGDPRAGGVQRSGRGAIYTGQYAAAKDAIDAMAMNEGLELGDVAIAPAEPLASTYLSSMGTPYGRLFG